MDCKLLILTCSKYSDLWSNHLACLEKCWPNHFEFIVVSDGKGLYDIKDIQNLRIYSGSMSTRLIKALNEIDSEYVLLTFDDYFLCKAIHDDDFSKLLEDFVKLDLDYLRFYKKPKTKEKIKLSPKIYKLPLTDVYEVNYYPGIWKVSSLLKILKDGEDIWKSEVRLTRRAREAKLNCGVTCEDLVHFKDIVRKGDYLISGKKFIQKNKLFLSDRRTRTIKDTIYLFFQTLISEKSPKAIKLWIKNKMRKRGKVFYSDFENTDD